MAPHAPMLWKALAVLLAGSWLALSAVDTLEDFVFPGELKIHAGKRTDFAGFGRATKSVYNLVQHGSRRIVAEDAAMPIPKLPITWVSYNSANPERFSRGPSVAINKLHNVLLI